MSVELKHSSALSAVITSKSIQGTPEAIRQRRPPDRSPVFLLELLTLSFLSVSLKGTKELNT